MEQKGLSNHREKITSDPNDDLWQYSMRHHGLSDSNHSQHQSPHRETSI
jgi:hypothetical protein